MDVIMPKMGESVSEGTIIKWHKKPGEQVKRDEIIFEISTDKVDTEIPSPADGVLSEIKVNEGETVDVGTVVAVIDGNGSSAKETRSSTQTAKAEKAVEEKKVEPAEQQEETPAASTSVVNTQEAERTSAPAGNIIEIAMPKMGESVMEGTIIKWHKKVGEPVKKDETIFEISTDKVDTEVPSPAAGTLAEILVAEQETVEVGTVVAKLASGDYKPSAKAGQEKTNAAKEEKPVKREEPESMHDNFSGATVPDVQEEEQTAGSKFYSPLVLSIAKKENVGYNELENIKGTGLE
ncbi:MAG: biotin/lipoyl-containing protein, partial [Ignavibacteriaceae bacterium]